MSAELVGWVAWGLVFLGLVVGSFFVGFLMGRARGQAEGYRSAWRLIGGKRL